MKNFCRTKKAVYCTMAAVLVSAAVARGQGADPSGYLLTIPPPAAGAAEALARCPEETDTSMRGVLAELVLLTKNDTVDMQAADLHMRLQAQYFTRLQSEFQMEMRAAGEHVDAAIRQCPKVPNNKGIPVYDTACVAAAEKEGSNRRTAAVDHFLLQTANVWPEYLTATYNIIAGEKGGKWLIVLRVATDAARITEMGAQFAR